VKFFKASNTIVCFFIVSILFACQSEMIESKKKYNATISTETDSLVGESNEIIYLPVKVKNRGSRVWEKGSEFPVLLSYHLLDPQGNMLMFDNSRTGLAADLEHGESAELLMVIEPLQAGRILA
jgi:hypothetical protein